MLQAAKEKAAQDKESYQRQISMSRGGSRRGGDRGDFAQVGPDGWAVAGNGPPRPPPKAGDLSKFGQISKPSSTMTFGPGSVFAGKKESKRESLSRTSSNSNMFSMLSQNAESAADASSKGKFLPDRRDRSMNFSYQVCQNPLCRGNVSFCNLVRNPQRRRSKKQLLLEPIRRAQRMKRLWRRPQR